MKLLDSINSPEDIKHLNMDELNSLCRELREYILENVSKTGGHLASNLGVVELTVALHRVFNTPHDKIIWDVGHQTYAHKILTGRKNKMSSLRQLNGISGFPKRNESIFDVFDTGHSSTSVSAAMGMARARDLNNEDYEIVAVIGDGALTGGMAFEAINDAGRSNTKLLIILNDNEMSISKNVGGLSRYLSRIRTTKGYLSTKRDVEKILNKIPVGKQIKSFLKRAKDGIKQIVVPGMLFEELGLTYMGPIDGHNIHKIIESLERAKNIEGPLLMHVITKKGKGYKFAEERPNEFHGVSAFNIETGEALKKSSQSYSDYFGMKMCEIAEKNENVVAITAAMTDGTGLRDFAKKFPNRIYDAGIAEQHAVTMAAGLAVSGVVPVVALYSSFLQRAYDQIIHDVALQNLHVVFAVDRAGLVGNDGETHQGVFDEGFLSLIPNMTVLSPADYREFGNMMEFAVSYNGPVAIRYPRGSMSEYIKNSEQSIVLGKGYIVEEGKDITIAAAGKMVKTAIETREILKTKNIDAEVLNLRFIKPFDKELIINSVNKTKSLVIIDEATVFASYAVNIYNILPKNLDVMVKTLPDEFIKQGSIEELLKENQLDADSIAAEIIKWKADNYDIDISNNYTCLKQGR
ncbi:MAG TPA: 1-deoxy-D-xylulose-5-phosphate synthase [Sedimentibacter sp.]|jgi:1-deoxy-D-xylulose-5-phosphate synthase|nr:1-deoxy-D-xylulose-5-phosphate synthase [Sedimentibacter sp.]HOA19516.1 1-deoxy-D-xylulose-5-phosphate synthase [Sedimentibacter sp.]HOG62117.1 1-deoxy-D-xylulose-5-phosphate synthase [Sedimentibacter sp.]HPB78687.1 1-deoxy-D-xylulose-5-phosphate synthase [Sedimentibacter sp.]HPY55852.1 1-deoxy-D-xylulose-5-phosphate synthase [Sedimentibacter sp.]